MDLAKARNLWFQHGTAGVLLMGSGISILFDAAFRRLNESVAEIWILEGASGFVLLMAGCAFFGSAIRYLVHMDRIVEYEDRKAKRKRGRQGQNARPNGLRLETDDAVTTVRQRKERISGAS